MTNTNVTLAVIEDLTQSTADAYSFKYYGAKNWRGCIAMLIGRGYSRAEVEAILRSKLTNWATDRIETSRRANALDLADTMDNRMGGTHQLAEYIAGVVEEIAHPTPEVLPSRFACRLVVSN